MTTENPNKFCLILRGLPGTGKDLLVNALIGENLGIPIINTDQFFMKNGKYHFDKTQLEEAHKHSFELFKEAISREEKLIIVNNTNIKKFHYYHYLDYAQRHGYLTALVVLPHNDVSNKELATRNIHGVDQDTIRRMRQAFEWEV